MDPERVLAELRTEVAGPEQFEFCRRAAHALLGNAQDELRHWNRGSGLTTEQSQNVARARRHLAAAKQALDAAAR